MSRTAPAASPSRPPPAARRTRGGPEGSPRGRRRTEKSLRLPWLKGSGGLAQRDAVGGLDVAPERVRDLDRAPHHAGERRGRRRVERALEAAGGVADRVEPLRGGDVRRRAEHVLELAR